MNLIALIILAVLPAVSAMDLAYGRLPYSEPFGDHSLRHCALQSADFSNLFRSEFGAPVFASPIRPAFTPHIGHVLLVSPEKQVIGADAFSVVALVTDEHSVRDVSEMEPVRQAVYCDSIPVEIYVSVSSTSDFQPPFPASGYWIHQIIPLDAIGFREILFGRHTGVLSTWLFSGFTALNTSWNRAYSSGIPSYSQGGIA